MYGSKTSKTTSATGKSGGGNSGSLLPQTDVKTKPLHTCKCGAQSTKGSCPRGH